MRVWQSEDILIVVALSILTAVIGLAVVELLQFI